MKNKEIDYSLFKNNNEFTFTLPKSQNQISFKMLTHKDERQIENELKGLKKINLSAEVTTRLKYSIVAVNNNREAKAIREFVDNFMLAADAQALREYIK
jgi:hypothetical protein